MNDNLIEKTVKNSESPIDRLIQKNKWILFLNNEWILNDNLTLVFFLVCLFVHGFIKKTKQNKVGKQFYFDSVVVVVLVFFSGSFVPFGWIHIKRQQQHGHTLIFLVFVCMLIDLKLISKKKITKNYKEWEFLPFKTVMGTQTHRQIDMFGFFFQGYC